MKSFAAHEHAAASGCGGRPPRVVHPGEGIEHLKKKTKAGASQRSAALSQRSLTISDVRTLFLARAIATRRESTCGA